jgi:hypothetical protein
MREASAVNQPRPENLAWVWFAVPVPDDKPLPWLPKVFSNFTAFSIFASARSAGHNSLAPRLFAGVMDGSTSLTADWWTFHFNAAVGGKPSRLSRALRVNIAKRCPSSFYP